MDNTPDQDLAYVTEIAIKNTLLYREIDNTLCVICVYQRERLIFEDGSVLHLIVCAVRLVAITLQVIRTR